MDAGVFMNGEKGLVPGSSDFSAWDHMSAAQVDLLSKNRVQSEGSPGLGSRNTFDLVTSRHPIKTWWTEIARVLCPGGYYLSQEVGPDSVRELSEFIMGPWPPGSGRDPRHACLAAEAAGLTVQDLQFERLETVFNDVGAVVYFLRLVVWIVPGFSVERYRHRLRALHEHIQVNGPFVAHASRFLIEATKPR